MSLTGTCSAQQAVPPERLAAREWFREAGFGVFIHWGVYSKLAAGEWVMHQRKMTTDQYQPLAARFNPVEYDPAEWVALFKRAGANYITITSKHHDGFAMWDSKATDWDIVDATPYGKDTLEPLAEECKKQGLKLFFYHSHLDWTHPDYYPRGKTGRHSGRPDEGDFNRYLDFMDAQLAELLSGDYGEVAGIWFDGWWDQKVGKQQQASQSEYDPKATNIDWRLEQTYELIHRIQPACLIGNNHHVAPFPGEDFQMFERDLPGQNSTGFSTDSVIGELPLETCDTINKSWGYNAGDQSVKSTRELVRYLVRSAGQDANLLLNVGPKPDGTIQPEFVESLEAMGAWIKQFGRTVIGARGGPVGPQPWGVTTQRDEETFLHLLNAPEPDAEGWVPLSGTSGLDCGSLEVFRSKALVIYRRNQHGDLELQLSEGVIDPIDTILVAR